jgi:putative transposase
MPRTARGIVGGYCYHVLNRSNGRKQIFHDNNDYASFVDLIAHAQERIPVDVLAACLMPNHVHLLLRPRAGQDLARWAHWVFTSHVRRHHRKYDSDGRIWQGRFKASVIQQDRHLITVLRYVERNALSANLVARAEAWRWGSLNWRLRSDPPVCLSESPAPIPSNWVHYVNEPQSLEELTEVRAAVSRERPYGTPEWVAGTAQALGFTYSITPRGRPRKRARAGQLTAELTQESAEK